MVIELKAVKGVALTVAYPACDGEWSSQYVTAPAALDSEVSKDKGNFADCTNEWTEIQTSGVGTLDLTATEMTADVVVVKTTSSTAGVNFPLIVIHTAVDAMDGANTELAAIPTTISSLRTMLQFLFEYFRNARTETAAAESLKKEDGTTELGSRTLADNGATFTRGEMS